jgi:hypothetical protein
LEAPTLQEIDTAIEYLYPDYEGIYSDDQRNQINKLARELMFKRLKKQEGVH